MINNEMDLMNKSELDKFAMKNYSEIEKFKEAIKPAIEWFNKNCNPYQKIIIENGSVELVSCDIKSFREKIPYKFKNKIEEV